MIRQSLHKGFTLIEMLVYMGILLILSAAAVTFMLSFDDFIAQYRVETALYRSGTNAMEQLLLQIRQADSYNSAGSILNDENGALSVTTDSGVVVISRDADDLDLSIGGTDYGNLISEEATVTNFTVYEYDTAVGSMVRVKLGLSATVNGVSKDVMLYGGAVIRGEI